MLNWLFSLLIGVAQAANFGQFQAHFSPSLGPFSVTIPLGSFTQNTHTNAAKDSTDGGVNTSGSCFSGMSTLVTLPTSDVYTFTLMAYSFNTITTANQNAVQVLVDGFPINAVSPTAGDYFVQFVTNVNPPTAPYEFIAPVQAGSHMIGVGLCTAQSQALAGISVGVHGASLIIAATSTGIPAEPTPQTRDPYLYPGSSWDFVNTAIGSSATFSLNTDPATVVINGLSPTINSTCFSVPLYQGQPTDPIGTYTLNDTTYPTSWLNGTLPFSLHINPSDTVDPCSDQSIGVADSNNHRYFYFGSNPGSISGNPAAINVGIGGTIDTYRQWSSVNESQQVPGLIRAQDITDGVIAHSLVIGLTYVSTASGGNYSTLTQLGWPVTGYDYSCFVGSPTNCTGTIPPGVTVGLPSAVNCTTLVATVGGQMICHALQDYGATHDVQSGSPSAPGIFFYAEAAAAAGSSGTILGQMGSDLATIVPQLRILTNNTPTTFYSGTGGNVQNQVCPTAGCAKGGGTPRQALRPGLIQGYASVIPAPSPPPSQSPFNVAGMTYGLSSGQCITTTTAVPAGDSVFFIGAQQNAFLGSFSGFTDSGGNIYTIAVQQTNSVVPTPVIAYSLNITHALPIGSTLCAVGSFGGGTWLGSIWAAAGVNGGLDKTAQQANGTGTGFTFTSPTLSQSNELVLFMLNGQTNLGVITEGLSAVEMQDGIYTGATYSVRTTGGTVTWTPSWNGNSSQTQAIFASFKIP